MLKLAESYKLSSAGKAAELRSTPLFSWANPERQAIGGEMFLWTIQGRPLATIGIWTYDDIKDSYEMQSLSTDPLKALRPQGESWQPRIGGLAFKKLEDVAIPDSSPTRRQTQMRNMLREMFSAELTKSGTGQIEKLRLLSQPLYRYAPMPADLIDGAMFAFAYGTDPEVFVLIEARKEKGEEHWYYAFAPSTSGSVQGFLNTRLVWDNKDAWSNGTFYYVNDR